MSEKDDKNSLEELDRRLRAAKAEQDKARRPATKGGQAATGMAVGFRIAIEIIAALAMGFGIGYFLDQWLGTTPWLMILFFFLGIGAAFVNVIRVARQLENKKSFRNGDN